MPLDWDIKLDTVSIKDEITNFSIRESKGAYVKELTISSANPSFYDLFAYTGLPEARVEVLTKIVDTWVSQGMFFIEKPVMVVNTDTTTSPGVWGRSITAKLGPPFAVKVSKTYDENTNFDAIIAEMAALGGITITSEITSYSIMAGSYVVDGLYPIDVIVELSAFAAAYVVSTSDGELIIKDDIFHPAAEDHTFLDIDIADIAEQTELPTFGNRIRISALGGVGSGYNVSLEPLNESDCLPADGTSKGTLLAFVTDAENEPVSDNTIVHWTTEEGVTLDQTDTATGDYLLSGRKHQASNFYEVDVDFPIKEIIGIWAYSDSGNRNNLWDPLTGSFDDRTITVGTGFAFCDQTLRITYITSGCAVNKVTAGSVALDVEVTAEFEGVRDSLEIKLGNTCACGSGLNIKVNPTGSICIGNLANVLVWGTIYNQPAVGEQVEIRVTTGCGELSSENKLLGDVEIIDEASYVENVISGTSQVKTEIAISGAQLPYVYEETDTAKSNNLYSSFEGKIIDLDTVLPTGTKVIITYIASGATLVAWRTIDLEKDCDSVVTVSMNDGTEAGQHSKVSLRAIDCTVHDSPPEDSQDYSIYDPSSDDQGSDGSGGLPDDGNTFQDEFGNTFDPCLPTVAERILNAENATSDEELTEIRFGVKEGGAECPDDNEFDCPCEELCQSEINEKGNTYDYDLTVHEIVTADGYVQGTPEYEEEFNSVLETSKGECVDKCEDKRLLECGSCDTVVGPEQLVPGTSAEYTCSNGVSKIITMPIGHCGTLTETVGCCEVKIRSTDGQWVCIEGECGYLGTHIVRCYYPTIINTHTLVWSFKDGEYYCSGGTMPPPHPSTLCVDLGTAYCGHPCPEQYPDPPNSHIRCVRTAIGRVEEWQCI